MRTNISRATVIGAAAALATTAFSGPAGAAPTGESATQSSSARNYYGALSLNTRTLAIGGFYDSRTRSHAQKMAQTRCKQYSWSSYCRSVVWVRNGCAAIAVKYDSKNRPVRYASAHGLHKWPTVRLAKKRAQGSSSAGTVKTRGWVCTTRYY